MVGVELSSAHVDGLGVHLLPQDLAMGGEHRDRAHQLGWYGRQSWRKRAKRQLKEHPLCRLCFELNGGLVVVATIADHVEPHGGDWHKFRYGALQSLCQPCHDSTKATIEKRGYSLEIGADGWPVDPRHPAYGNDRQRG